MIWLGKSTKPWITQKVMDKMEEGRKWKNIHNEEGSKNYRRLRYELKSATDQAKNNIWTAYVTRYWNVEENDVMI